MNTCPSYYNFYSAYQMSALAGSVRREVLKTFTSVVANSLDLLSSYLLKFGCRRFDEGKILMASGYLATVCRAIPIA